MELTYFLVSLGISVVLFLVAIIGFQSGRLRVKGSADGRIADLESKIKWLTEERDQLISKVLLLERKEERNKVIIAELQERVGIAPAKEGKPFVLGIWPQSDLDTTAERAAVYNAGFAYRALSGPAVSRTSILRELRAGKVTILEIGAHGDSTGVMINGQNLSAGWWENALRDQAVNIEVALLLACSSDSSIAASIKRAGVPHVIAIDGAIDDAAAVEFAQQFYQLYADGETVRDAVDDAKLSLEPNQAERIVLR